MMALSAFGSIPGEIQVRPASTINELLCPECQSDTPSTEAYEMLGVVLCTECAAHLFDPGDGWPEGAT